MQLNLRTLLAYLDDALEPAETTKVAESLADNPAARDTIARVRKVTRRLSLSAPTGEFSFEPHQLAAYLDGTLNEKEAGEIEKACRESDECLAELASCRQILTQAQGEPPLIPPTASERMYGLVKGKEAVKKRKQRRSLREPVSAAPTPTAYGADDGGSFGFPGFLGQTSWLRWGVPVLTVCLLLVLGAIFWTRLSDLFADINSTQGSRTLTENSRRSSAGKDSLAKGSSSEVKGASGSANGSGSTSVGSGRGSGSGSASVVGSGGSGSASASSSAGSGSEGSGSASAGPIKVDAWVKPPKSSRVEVGKTALVLNVPTVLLQRRADIQDDPWEKWESPAVGGSVFTGDVLMALPGCRSSLSLKRGVDLLLWGNVPNYLVQYPLMESAVVLHESEEYDVDFTLLRGRVVLTNVKNDEAKVLLRFGSEKDRKETWKISLPKGAEVGIEIVGRYFDIEYGSGLPPVLVVNAVALKETAGVKATEFQEEMMINARLSVSWDNVGSAAGPEPFVPEVQSRWDRANPNDRESIAMINAGRAVEKDLRDDPKVLAVAQKTANAVSKENRILGVHCLGAIDALPDLLDSLTNERQENRDAAQESLKQWIGRSVENEARLHKMLVEKGYKDADAVTILQLLHGLTNQLRQKPQTWEWLISLLSHQRGAICYLAHWNLVQALPEESKKIVYNPNGEAPQKEGAKQEWKKLIPPGKLPPAPK